MYKRMLTLGKDFWRELRTSLLNPTVSEMQLQAQLYEARQQLPTPIFWLLGKTQAGKTSIIRALTGCNDAEIGNGFQACTRTARMYDFPDSENCVLRFLDSRGIGEVGYEPDEELALYETQSHVIIAVLKVTDHAQQAVVNAIKKVHDKRPHWPLMVVQTQLHEAYPTLDTSHIIPYPYHTSPWPATIPNELQRALQTQRNWFEGLQVEFVAVDFTLPEDGYSPVNYGLEALWDTLEKILPLGLHAMLMENQEHRRGLRDVFVQSAHPHIIGYALVAGGLAATPAPFISTPLVLTVQAKMVQTLASIYQQPLDSRQWSEMAGALGIGYLLRLGGRELAKLVPGYGSAFASLYTAMVTYALGKTVGVYFSRVRAGDVPDASVFAAIYKQELIQGREILKQYMQTMNRS